MFLFRVLCKVCNDFLVLSICRASAMHIHDIGMNSASTLGVLLSAYHTLILSPN